MPLPPSAHSHDDAHGNGDGHGNGNGNGDGQGHAIARYQRVAWTKSTNARSGAGR